MISIPCDACNTDAGEPCRPTCTGHAAVVDTLTDDDRRVIALARKHWAPIALHVTAAGKTMPAIRNLSTVDLAGIAALLERNRADGHRAHLSLDTCG